MKIISVIKDVFSQEQIDKDKAYKREFKSKSGGNFMYTGGFSSDCTRHVVIVEYEDGGMKRQYKKNLMHNNKGYYIKDRNHKRYFIEQEVIDKFM